jgi:uncharacterized repeat protein (TIGR02543 family)
MVLLVFFLLQLNAVAAEPEATVQYLHDSSAATITLSAKSNDTVTNGIAYLQGQVDKAGTLELYVNGEKKGSDTLEAGDTFDFSDIALREERNSVELRHVGSAGTTRQLYNFYYLIEWDILVDGSFAGTDGNPGTDGIPVYKTVGAAVVSVPATNDAEKIIYIKSGTYNERVVVTSPYITLLGEDRANTTIYYSINTYDTVQSGLDSSYRNAVKIDATAVHFHGENLTFENSATYTNGTDQQAEALRVLADQSSFVNVKLVSFLNTLLVGRTSGSSTPIRVYFENCYITGNDSFIYGDASAYFQDCQIVARYTKDKSGGTYVRPGTGIDGEGSNNPGFVFSDCAFEAEAGVTPDSHTLATSNSNSASVTFLNCYMSEEVNANSPYTDSNSAWDPTFGKGSNKEYQSYGEGVDTSGTANRPQIETAAEAANYDAEDILAPPGGGEAFEVPTYNPSTESANSLYLKTGTSDSTGGLFIGSKESTTLAYPGRGTKWTWDYETKTLTIKENTEFTTKADTALVLTCDTTFSITGNLSLNGNKYGIKSENGDDITVSDGEIVTSGSVAAISTAGMLSLPTAYQYYTNTEPTAPSGDGTIYPSEGTSSFTYSSTYQYIRIKALALYQVMLDKNDGTAASSLGYVAAGGSVAELTAPTRTDFSFGGWYREAACSNAWNFASDTVTASLTSGGNFTLYAKWTDNKDPVLSAGSISRTGDTQATIGFTTDEYVTVYYQAVNDGANAPDTSSWSAWTSIGARSAGAVSGESITLSAGVKDVWLAAADATGNVGTLKLDANSIVNLTVQKDGAAYAAHGKTFSLYQSAVKKYDGNGTGGTVTFSNIVAGSYDVYEGTTNTGLSISVTDSASGSGTLSYYTVQFAVANSGSASGSTISALYNSATVTTGSVVQGGKTLSVTAAGAGADLYTYAWSGTGSNSETTSTISFTSLGQAVNLTCTVGGTTEISVAKTAVEGATYTTTQSAAATDAAAKAYVQGVVSALSEIDDGGVTPTYTWVEYTAPTAGTTTDLDGTNGSLTFTVTLNKGGGTAQTTSTLTLTITATAYNATQDNTDLATAKTAVENETYQIAQSALIEATVSGGDAPGDAAIEASAKAYVISTIENIAAIEDASITVTFTWGSYAPAQAGTPVNLNGINGSLQFALQLQKGGGTPVIIDNLSLNIIATPYDTNPDNADITTARLLIEGARYQDIQANLPDHDTAMIKIQTILGGLALNGVTAAIVEEGYTSAIAGTAENPTGTNGSLTFHVTLNKGGGTQQNSASLTLTILAAAYISPAPTIPDPIIPDPIIPAPTIPAADGMVEVEYVGEGSDIQLLLPQEKIEELLEHATEDNVVFHLSLNGAIREVAIPVSAIQAFLDAGKGIEVEMAAGSITLSNDALRSFLSVSPGSEIAFHAEQMPISTLSPTQQAALAPGDVVYDLAVLLDNQPVHTFDGEITLALPYSGETPVSAWYLSDDGTLEKMQGTYDSINKLFYFTPPHLSLYLIGPDKDNGAGITLSNVYIPTTEKGEEILSAKVAVYEDAILTDGSAARIYLTGISSQIKAGAEQAAIERGMQLPFAMVDVHGVGVSAGQAMTVTFNLMNVAEGNKIAVLHLLPDGTWEILEPIRVGNGTVKVTVTADSVVAFVRTAADDIPRSPNNGDMESWSLWVIALMMLTIGMFAISIYAHDKRKVQNQ